MTIVIPGLLNLGCGSNKLPGFWNVDIEPSCHPDEVWNLESTPWPWPDNSFRGIAAMHILEHLGKDSKTYLNIIKELYRVSKPDAEIKIIVPHPNHYEYLSDPTHVRPITETQFTLYDKGLNQECIDQRAANTPLGLLLDVDFRVTSTVYLLDEPWKSQYEKKEKTEEEIKFACRTYFNVVKQVTIMLKAVK